VSATGRGAGTRAVHGARRYTRGELVERVRAAGFTPLLASYAYCLVFPAVAAVRLARRGAAGGSDVFPLPRPLNAALLGVQAMGEFPGEARLARADGALDHDVATGGEIHAA